MNRVILLTSLLIAHQLFAFPPPIEKKNYYSPNKLYRLLVIPNTFEKSDSNYCYGKLFKLDEDSVWQLIYICKLDNIVTPINAIVSNNGDYFVTFGNWEDTDLKDPWNPDNSDNFIVIYGPGGTIIKKYSLEDLLTKEEIDNKSIQTQGHYIDNEIKTLVLGVIFKKKPYIQTIRIDIRNGEIIKYNLMNIDIFKYKELRINPKPIYLPIVELLSWKNKPYSLRKFNVNVELLINIDGSVSSVKILEPRDYYKNYYWFQILNETIKAKFSPPKNFDMACRVIIRGVYKIIPNKPSTLEIKN